MGESIRRIVVLGKTGAGKSSLANTIFADTMFKVYHSVNSGTSKCKAETKTVNGREIMWIDTPGLFDTDRPEEDLKSEILRCITECAPGPHAFLIVLKVEKFTEHEQAVINRIQEYFSEEAFKYATVLLTHGDQLPEEETIMDFVKESKVLSDMVEKCGGRCHVIDNKYWKNNQKNEYRSNQFQVEELLKTIDTMTEANHGSHYTNKMLQDVNRKIEEEKEHIGQSSENMSPEEIMRKAKTRVFGKLLFKAAGASTGAVLGCFLGRTITLMNKEGSTILLVLGTDETAETAAGANETDLD